MRVEREHFVTVIIAAIAILVVVGGYASFSGLVAYEAPLNIEMNKKTFKQSDVFDVNVLVTPVTLLADDSIMVSVDNKAIGVIAIKKYLDDNNADYGKEIKNMGQNNLEIINLKNPLTVNLADFVSLDYLGPDTMHVLKVEFSNGEGGIEEVFGVE